MNILILFYLSVPINRYWFGMVFWFVWIFLFGGGVWRRAILDNKEIKILTYSPWTICVNIQVDYTYGSAIDKSKVKIFEL